MAPIGTVFCCQIGLVRRLAKNTRAPPCLPVSRREASRSLHGLEGTGCLRDRSLLSLRTWLCPCLFARGFVLFKFNCAPFKSAQPKERIFQTPQTHNRAHYGYFSIVGAHLHKKNELRGVRNKKVRWWWYFFEYATLFVSMQHTLIKLSGNGLLSSKALRNRSQNCWDVSQSEVMRGC